MHRKEKSGKVIPLILWRAMAAAVFIGFGLWVTISYFNKTEKNIPVASQINKIKQPAAKEKNIIPKEPVKSENEIASSTKTTEPEKTEKEETEIKKPIVKQKNTNNIAVAKPDLKIKKPIVKEEIKELKPDIENQTIAITNAVKKAPEFLQNQKNRMAENEPAQTINKIDPEIQNTKAQTVSYVPDASTITKTMFFMMCLQRNSRNQKLADFLKKVNGLSKE